MADRRWTWILLFGVAMAPLIEDCRIEKFFSADGAAYFSSVLEDGKFTDIAWSRNHANYLVQWPLVWAVRAGVTDWRWLEALFGAGLLLPHVLGFALALVARRGLPAWPLVFPIASLLTINLSSSYLMVCEHHVAAALAWPIAFFALRPGAYARWELLIIAALLVANIRLYECAVLTGPVFAVLFAIRRSPSAGLRAAHLVFAALCLVSAYIAAQWILFPRDPANRQSFLGALVQPLGSSQFVTDLLFLAPFLFSLWKGRDRIAWVGLVASAGAAAIALSAVAFVVGPWRLGPVTAGTSFGCRTLSITLLPLLLVVAAWLIERGIAFSAGQFRSFALFVVLAGAMSVHGGRQWAEFRSLATETLHTRSGFVPIEETALAGHPCVWNWNNPTLSYLWSGGEVRAIILNPSGNGWEPFDPRTTAILANYIPRPRFLPPR